MKCLKEGTEGTRSQVRHVCMGKPTQTQFPAAHYFPHSWELRFTCCGIWLNLGDVCEAAVAFPLEETPFLSPHCGNLTFTGTWAPRLEPVPKKQARMWCEIGNS